MKMIRMLVGLFVMFAVIYTGWKTVPVYFSNYQLEESMDDIARMATTDARRTPEDIRTAVFQSAQQYEIPLQLEDIDITRNGSDVLISANYAVQVDLPLYPFELKFHPSTKRQGLSFH